MLRFPKFSKTGGPAPTDAPADAPTDARGLLQWSMDRYAAMNTFAAHIVWTNGSEPLGHTPEYTRTIAFAAPNRFRLESHAPNGYNQFSICDGKTFVEYTTGAEGQDAMSYPVPPSLAAVLSTFTSHPMFCGTLLYRIFGGRRAFDALVDESHGKPRFEADEPDPSEADEPVNTVGFYAAGMYGNARLTIGRNTGLVHRVVYDSEPLMVMMNSLEHRKMIRRAIKVQLQTMEPGDQRDAMERQLAEYESDEVGPAPKSTTIETYSDFRIDEPIGMETFDTTLPAGLKARDMSRQERAEPPIPPGEAAPDFEVKLLGGGPARLSDMRGKVVLIDFWATWCGPCRRGLPETDRLAALGPDSGLAVMAITNEPSDMVSEFLAEEGYQFPCYIDEGGKAQRLYRPPGIPALVIVDAQGTISDYFVGLQDPKTVERALKKAGAKV